MTNSKYLAIKIGGVDYSKYMTFPFTVQDCATEQLSTAIVSLVGLPTNNKFKPFTEVSIANGKYEFLVADDSVKAVIGRNLWNHELTLIEKTKELERVLMEGKSFTNPLIPDLGENPNNSVFFEVGNYANSFIAPEETYKTPIVFKAADQKKIKIFSVFDVFGFSANGTVCDVSVSYSKSGISWVSIDNRKTVEEYEIDISDSQLNTIFKIQYSYTYVPSTSNVAVIGNYETMISVIRSNDSQKNEYTVIEVLNGLLDISEPIRDGLDSRRFDLALTSKQYLSLRSLSSPEMHFANGRSLLENLSQVGGYIHAIPKLKKGNDISFIDLGTNEKANFSKGTLIADQENYNASDYASKIESNFANLINTDDEEEGSITDPYGKGFITLRSNESRIKEGNSFVPTKYPVAKLKQFLVRLPDGRVLDITKYVFERSEYETLSSFSGVFPYSKTHALFYTNGAQNIDGLWYRAEDSSIPILNYYKKYAITNIINEVSGSTSQDYDYMSLAFRVTYIPIINGRARQARTEYSGEKDLVIAHNQSANKLSAISFGENLRGQIAKMSTSKSTPLYLFKDLSDVPSAGLLYDNGVDAEIEYISSITTRVFPSHCLAQIDISKNYNALGSYTELKNDIRQYEIPEGQERTSLFEEYCFVSTDQGADDGNALATSAIKTAILESLNANAYADATFALVQTLSKEKRAITDELMLPVYSTSLGNSAFMGFSFEDNFSSGSQSIGEQDIGGSNQAYRLMQPIPYGDAFYATAEYLHFKIGYSSLGAGDPINEGNQLPQSTKRATQDIYYVDTAEYPLIWKKDTADHCKVAYQLHFVSDENIIIGSDLARSMPFVRSKAKSGTAKIFFYDKEINQLTGEEEGASVVASSTVSIRYGEYWNVDTSPAVNFKSWAIRREDENGNRGPCIMGKNTSENPYNIHFYIKRKR